MTQTQENSRRLLQSLLVSLNGVTSEPPAWAGPYFGEGSAAHSLEVLERCEALLMGRRTYDVFSRQWPSAPGPYAARLNAMPKYVFSSTIEEPGWNNTTVIAGDPVQAVAQLKQDPGQDLIVYGHGRFGQTLCDAGLVDELTMTVVPVFADGTPLYRPGRTPQAWELLTAGPGKDPGLVSLTYRPASSQEETNASDGGDL
ncbi:dihydrofolate reductase family protein [Streptomyces sp. NPDC005813]|uniref:dihydrofolate reductase family protein n=1 Tax=Streptomyces sp. NPDC005813 TaxID=3155592 RepID=UPI003408E9C0